MYFYIFYYYHKQHKTNTENNIICLRHAVEDNIVLDDAFKISNASKIVLACEWNIEKKL